jgi:hypothetical protein
MTAMPRHRFAREALEWGVTAAAVAAVFVLIYWLKSAFGVSLYWFIGGATMVAVLSVGVVAWLITRPHPSVFVLDWVAGMELLAILTMLAGAGLFALASRVWTGWVLGVVGVGLLALTAGTISYALRHAPSTTWDDDDT